MRLGDVADVVAGFAFPEVHQGRVGLPTPFIKVSDFASAQDSWISTAVNTVDDRMLKLMRAKIYPPGTVVFPKVGGALLTNKRARLSVSATFDNNVMGLIPRSVDGDYLYWFMRQFDMAFLANTQALPSVRASDVARIDIPVPQLPEQRQIAARLKAQLAEVETARQAAQAQVREAEVLRMAIYRDAFRHVVPVAVPPGFNDSPPGWRWRKLVDIARLESGHTPSRSRPDWWGGDVSWISLTEIRALDGQWVQSTQLRTNAAGIANSSARILPHGTVCYSRTASVGFVAIMATPMATSQDFANWVCSDALDPEFLMHALIRSRQALRELATGATHKTIYMPMLESFHLCAPDADEQRRIVARLKTQLAEADAIHQAATAQLAEIERLPQRLLAQAFAPPTTQGVVT
jgi:type I restriction enzyme S subunit